MTDHTQRLHAKYSGSVIKRLRRCGGHVRLTKALGRSWVSSDSAEEGTIVHELLEVALRSGLEVAREQATWSQARENSITWAVDYASAIKHQYPDVQFWFEERVYFPQKVVPRHEAAGVADIMAVSLSAGTGWLIDFKNGVDPVDDPVCNDQLRYYATAAFWEVPLERIKLVIVQPNGLGVDPVREAEVSAVELLSFRDDIERLILHAEGHDATLTPGEWCARCAVGAECSTRERAAIAALTGHEGVFRGLLTDELPHPENLDAERWAEIKEKARFVRSFLDDVENAAYLFAVGGGEVPRFKLVESQGRRVFEGGVRETAKALAELTGRPVEAFINVSLVGITETEKLVKEVARRNPDPDSVTKRFAALLSRKASGKTTLVPETDPRPAFNKAATAFSGVIPDNLITEKDST